MASELTTAPAAGRATASDDMNTAPGDLIRYLDDTAVRLPDADAVVATDGSTLTYRELALLSEQVAAFLHDRGVRPGDRVGLLLPKSARTVATIFGILRAGAAYVPLDPKGPARRAATILSDCQVRILFTTPDHLDHLTLAAPNLDLEPVLLTGPGETSAAGPHRTWEDVLHTDEPAPRTAPTPDRLAYLLYTSGSTGAPKGVAITHRNAVSFVEWASDAFNVTSADRVTSHAPFHFDLSIFDLFVSVRAGASIHLIDPDLAASPRHLPRFVADHGITIWYSAPAILGMIGDLYAGTAHPPNRLRLVLFAGEVFPLPKLRRIKEFWSAPDYYNLYGPTETNVCTYQPIPPVVPDERNDPYPIGAACSHCHTLLVDRHLQPVGDNEEGFLCISGPSVFPGYWTRGGPTPAPAHFTASDGRLWYNTGDVVRREDGVLVFLGRRDRMVKRQGYRIELDEIEKALAAHPQVDEVAVVSTEDAGQVLISAFTVGRDEPPTAVDLSRHCHAHVAPYMIPDEFRALAELPRTSTGKTDYRSLEKLCQLAPTPSTTNAHSSNALSPSPVST